MKEVTLELTNDKLFFDILLGLDIIHSDWHDGKYYFTSLEEDDWRKCFQKIRFINPENKFDYAKYGEYFIYSNKLFIITDCIGYLKFESKNLIDELFYKELIHNNKFVIEANFAGFSIGRKDDFGESIYYGDVLKIELNNFSKCKNCKYFGGPFKDRNNVNINIVYGPISLTKGWNHCANPNEPYYIKDQDFGVIPNLCSSIKTEIVANIYYDVFYNSKIKFNLNIIQKAILSDTFVTCKFWDFFISKANRKGKSNNEIWENSIISYRKKINLSI